MEPYSMILILLVLVSSDFFCLQTIALDNGLFLTPPMGWLSWFAIHEFIALGYNERSYRARFRCNTDCNKYPNECISEGLYRSIADTLVNDGWLEAGYNFVNIDDCWAEKKRDPKTNALIGDRKRFPSGMKALGEYLHMNGLKFGIYGDCGTKTCAKYPGSLMNYENDAETFASWGVDSLKFDGCFANVSQMETLYSAMSQALNKTGRSIAFICSWPAYTIGNVDLVKVRKYCNAWRNYDDIENTFASVNNVIEWFAINQKNLSVPVGPGGWNDPDMIVIGNYGLTVGQAQIQMAIWAILAAPLMLGNDPRLIDISSKRILLNKDVIGVNQDILGLPGKRIQNNSIYEVWTRVLKNDDLAVAVLRRQETQPFFPVNITIYLDSLDWTLRDNGSNQRAVFCRDLFEMKNMGVIRKNQITVKVAPQNVVMLRLSSKLKTEIAYDQIFDNNDTSQGEVMKFAISFFCVLSLATGFLLFNQIFKRRGFVSINA